VIGVLIVKVKVFMLIVGIVLKCQIFSLEKGSVAVGAQGFEEDFDTIYYLYDRILFM